MVLPLRSTMTCPVAESRTSTEIVAELVVSDSRVTIPKPLGWFSPLEAEGRKPLIDMSAD